MADYWGRFCGECEYWKKENKHLKAEVERLTESKRHYKASYERAERAHDESDATITNLKAEVERLREELADWQQGSKHLRGEGE